MYFWQKYTLKQIISTCICLELEDNLQLNRSSLALHLHFKILIFRCFPVFYLFMLILACATMRLHDPGNIILYKVVLVNIYNHADFLIILLALFD